MAGKVGRRLRCAGTAKSRRRYPFVFASSADGKPTPFVDKVLEFLKDYQAQFERTRVFCRRLKEFGVLEPMPAKVTTPKGEQLTLAGFLVVGRDKLRALSAETLQQLAKSDELELLYLHLASMRNFNEVKERLIGTLADAPPTAAA